MEIRGFKHLKHWYKGNLHSHTTNSDGKLTPWEAAELYKRNGYHFLCFSEHDKFTDYRSQFDAEDFLILPGLEASAALCEAKETGRKKKVHHIHGILGTEAMQKEARARGTLFSHMEMFPSELYYGEWDGQAAADRLSDELRGRGCFTTYNHPVWSRVREDEFLNTKGIWAVEIYNYNTVNESGTGYDTLHWDEMLRAGKRVFGFASDDNHNEGLFDDSCGGYVMVNADCLSHEEIVNNLLIGNYYSSSGPEIYDFGIRDGRAYVECSPVYRIDFIAGNLVNDGRSVIADNREETISRAVYTIKGHETYIRVECTDCWGKTAWSNPLFLP